MLNLVNDLGKLWIQRRLMLRVFHLHFLLGILYLLFSVLDIDVHLHYKAINHFLTLGSRPLFPLLFLLLPLNQLYRMLLPPLNTRQLLRLLVLYESACLTSITNHVTPSHWLWAFESHRATRKERSVRRLIVVDLLVEGL